MKNIIYYSKKPIGSFHTSIILFNKDLEYVDSTEITNEDVRGYCECLNDLGIKYISKSDEIKIEIYNKLINNLLSDLSLEQREQM